MNNDQGTASHNFGGSAAITKLLACAQNYNMGFPRAWRGCFPLKVRVASIL